MEAQKTPISPGNLGQKDQTGCIIVSDFKTYYRVTVTQTAWFWHKNRHRDGEPGNKCIHLG
jgi:hypothetical protein